MATCPTCKEKLAWYRFLGLPWLNAKLWITCKNCGNEARPRNWLPWLLFLCLSTFALGGAFIRLSNSYDYLSKYLFLAWLLYAVLSDLLLVFARFDIRTLRNE
jgi:hypothetical protein